jgi:hypothetical protein
MTAISGGFGGRRRDDVDPSRIPPGQHYELGFPVLSAGSTHTSRRLPGRWSTMRNGA